MSSQSSRITSQDNLQEKIRGILNDNNLRVELKDSCKFEVQETERDDECESILESFREKVDSLEEARRSGDRYREKELRNELKDVKRRFEEKCGDRYRTVLVMGNYTCNDNKITLYLGCYKYVAECKSLWEATDEFLRVLAHEIIHYLQFRNGSINVDSRRFSVKVRFNNCNDQKLQDARRFPYRFRPHEAEAFLRERELAALIRGKVERELLEVLRGNREALGL